MIKLGGKLVMNFHKILTNKQHSKKKLIAIIEVKISLQSNDKNNPQKISISHHIENIALIKDWVTFNNNNKGKNSIKVPK